MYYICSPDILDNWASAKNYEKISTPVFIIDREGCGAGSWVASVRLSVSLFVSALTAESFDL